MARRKRAETVGQIMRAFRESVEWGELAPRTRRDYEEIMEGALVEAQAWRPAEVEAADVVELRDRVARSRGRRRADYAVAVLSRVLGWGRLRGLVRDNAAARIPKLDTVRRRGRVANRVWREEELEAVLGAANRGVKVAVALAAWTGMRLGDVARAEWGWCRSDGWIEWETAKSRGRTRVEVPMARRLREILGEAGPAGGSGPATGRIVVGQRGRPLTYNGLSREFRKLVEKLEEKGVVGGGLTFHGLRHSVGTKLAEAGADLDTIRQVLGQETVEMARHYSRTARRAGQAERAIGMLEGNGG